MNLSPVISDVNKRIEMFLELKDCEASVRQLERLTGISRGIIQFAKI
jgi:hypothetical protein